MLQRNLQVNKFTRGIIRDGVDDRDYLRAMRALQNYDIDYTRGQLVKRKGYTRFNLVALANNSEQTYFYKNLAGNEYTLVVTNSKLYITGSAIGNTEVKNASVSTPASLSFTSGTKYPFVTLDDGRCVFADNNDIYWCDHASLTSAYCYQLGMDKPDIAIFSIIEAQFVEQNILTNDGIYINPPLRRQFAQSITPTDTYACDGIQLSFYKVGLPSGMLRITLETDNSGNPSGNKVSDNAYSDWLDIETAITGVSGWEQLQLRDIHILEPNTKYHFVVEFDAEYVNTADGTKYVILDTQNTNPYANGSLKSYDGTNWNNVTNSDARFVLGLQYAGTRKYRLSYYNKTYVIESGPSETIDLYIAQAGGIWEAAKITIPARSSISDKQATHINIYRNQSGGTDYYYVGRAEITASTSYIWDVIDDDSLADKLQSLTFQRPKDTDKNPIIPKYITTFKKRLYLVKANSSTIYYSMRLDDTGALGYAGFSLYDSFHSENFEQIPTMGEPITGILPLGNQLIVYTDSQIIPIYGCDSVLQPMDDLSMPETAKQNIGCIAPQSLVSSGDRHYFLSKRGVEEYDGNSVISISFNPNRGLYIQSIVDDWGNKSGTQAIITPNNEYWILADEEGIIKYEQEIYDEEYYAVPSTQIIYICDINKNSWRAYQFYHTLNHLLATPDNILLSPQKDVNANTFHIMLVTNNVYSDRDDDNTEINVAGLIETQNLRPLTSEMAYSPRRWLRPPTSWHHIVVDAFHVGSPFYTCKTIDKNNNVNYADLIITSDVRSKRTGLRVNSEECRFRIKQFSKTKDEIRGLIAEWTEM